MRDRNGIRKGSGGSTNCVLEVFGVECTVLDGMALV